MKHDTLLLKQQEEYLMGNFKSILLQKQVAKRHLALQRKKSLC